MNVLWNILTGLSRISGRFGEGHFAAPVGGDFGNSLRAASRHASEVDISRLHAAAEALFNGGDGVTETSIPQADIDYMQLSAGTAAGCPDSIHLHLKHGSIRCGISLRSL
jgi:hypothetical protein